jgi:CDP-diacylglycerol--glycerol-3-phosphate 3-phosphatidyltransferase
MVYAYDEGESYIALLALFALVSGGLIPYIRAKAESLGIDCSVGFAERAERLIILLVGTGFYGLGLQIAMPLSLMIVGIAGVITIAQRLLVVARS